ncbi:MAG: hypothetical protein HWE16_06060 [Gammaproteobacteria bacterium]|nr:hypothetical protein [Gammaproteobacteria bacterium]
MRFFIRFFIFLLVIGAAAYGYAWYKNKQAVDDLIVNKFKGSYRTTYIDVNGDSVIKGMSFNIPGLPQAATIDELRTGTGNILTNIKASKAFDANDLASLPDHFDLYFDVKGAKVPLDPIMDQASGNGTDNFFNNSTYAGCGDRRTMSIADLSALGIYSLDSDAKVKFTLDNSNKKAFADIYINLDKLNTTKINLSLNNFNVANPMGLSMSGGSIEVADNGIQRDINALCAKESELSEKQYTERHISYLKHLLFQENIYLSPEFYEQYAKYHANPRSIKISFHPSNDLQPMALMGASPRRLLSMLNTDVQLNDKSITPLFGNRPAPEELPQLDQVTPEDDGLTTIYGLKRQDTPVSSIGRYVGYDAYFDYRGDKFKGKIKSVSGSSAYIRYEVSTGNYVEKPFRLRDMSNLEVRREQSPPAETEATTN